MLTKYLYKANPIFVTGRWARRNTIGLVTAGVILLLWQVYAMFDGQPEVYFPSPVFTVNQTIENLDVLLQGMESTFAEVAAGWVLSAIIGILSGIILSESYLIRNMWLPLLLFMHSIPLAILAPIVLAFIGTGTMAIGLFVAWGGFFPIFINTITGMTQIRSDFNLLFEITGATWFQQLRYVRFRAAAPNIISGLKIATSIAVTASVIAELLAVGSGLGFVLVSAMDKALAGLMFGTIFVIMAFGIVWYFAISKVLDSLVQR